MAIRRLKVPIVFTNLLPFLRFCLVGISGVFVNYGAYLFLTRELSILSEVALVISIGLSIWTNFILNDLWTFRDRRTRGVRQFLRRALSFYIVSASGAIIQWVVAMSCYRFLGLDDRIAVFLGIAVAIPWNFGINLLTTWRKPVSVIGERRIL